MSLLSAANLAFEYPSTGTLFNNLNFSVNTGDRVAIVGPNGSGKTTLLLLLEGGLEPTSGMLTRRSGLTYASAEQQLELDESQTVLEYVFSARPQVAFLRSRLAALETCAGVVDSVEYAGVLHDYTEAGGYAAEAESCKLLHGLGFSQGEFVLPMTALSGGQRRRAALAKALQTDADLLLLDEPTNHLDSDGRRWLASELLRRRQACVLISHDRSLLRACATRIVDLGRRSSAVFECGYEEWRAAREVAERQAWADYEGAQRRKAAAEAAAEKRARLAVKVATPPPGVKTSQDFYARKAAKVSRTARMLRERSTTEAKVQKPYEEQPMPDLTFFGVTATGGFPLVAHGLSKRYGDKVLFEQLDLQVSRKARIAITGPNGSGKTTLLRVLAGLEEPDAGTVHRSQSMRSACLTQDSSHLNPESTPLEVCGNSTLSRTLMGCLKLRPDCVNRSISELSPGERAKVALVEMLASGSGLLLLDEPTEHLEIEAQEALERALASLPGALVVISHDQAFLDALGPELQTVRLGHVDVASV